MAFLFLFIPHYHIYFVFRIFSHAENEFNHIKEEFLKSEVSRGGDPSPDQNTRCTCSYTGFDQLLCSENNFCLYLQERSVRSFIL